MLHICNDNGTERLSARTRQGLLELLLGELDIDVSVSPECIVDQNLLEGLARNAWSSVSVSLVESDIDAEDDDLQNRLVVVGNLTEQLNDMQHEANRIRDQRSAAIRAALDAGASAADIARVGGCELDR